MSDSKAVLPTLIATSVVRGSQQGESHGGVYLLNFASQQVRQVVDWNTGEIDFSGRGWDRGLRGIAFHAGEIYIAASDELFVFDQNFKIARSFRCRFLKHCHEIVRYRQHLYLTSTAYDSILGFDLDRQQFFWALHLSQDEQGVFSGNPYDPNNADGVGPAAQNLLHLNNVHADKRGIWVSGLNTGGMIRIGDHNATRKLVDLPSGIHNAQPLAAGVLFNDTADNSVRLVRTDGSAIRLPVPMYGPDELTQTQWGDDRVARQGFGRGLCVVNEDFIAAGSSPSTVTLWHLPTAHAVNRVNFSTDIRNAIHGLEVWPYGGDI